ncbi:hypothetical protein K3495_g6494 [Podosphaera aphanis]|nr:hypothetical protein K3495_g6494 [Podosphaera aphanis]
MRYCRSVVLSLLALGRIADAAAWNFDEAIISVSGQGRADGRFRDKLSDHAALAQPVALGPTEKLKILITATEDGVGRRPHQAFLLLRDQDSGLESTLPFSLKDNGKGVVEFTQKELPEQFDKTSKPLRATLLLASFGESLAFSNHVFNLNVKVDAKTQRKYERPVRYGKLKEIYHTFKPDPESGSLIISIFFVFAVVATVPVLLASWIYTGANLSHLPKATETALFSHGLFYGSILAMECVFFLYYRNWTLFQVLPVALFISFITVLSGPKALSEVQTRRLAGER